MKQKHFETSSPGPKRYHKRNTLQCLEHLCWKLHKIKNSSASTGIDRQCCVLGTGTKIWNLGHCCPPPQHMLWNPLPSKLLKEFRITRSLGRHGFVHWALSLEKAMLFSQHPIIFSFSVISQVDNFIYLFAIFKEEIFCEIILRWWNSNFSVR